MSILIREGEDPKVSGILFKAVVQAVLLFLGRDVSPDPPDRAVPEQLPAQGRATDHQEEAAEEGGREMGRSYSGGSNGGGRI